MWPGVAQALHARIVSRDAVSGGDINSAWHVTLQPDHGATFDVFVKTNASPPQGMFISEAKGLAFLAQAKAMRTPTVLASGEDFLALEWIQGGQRAPDFDERFGHGLAALHRSECAVFGLDHQNFIGRLPQDNAAVIPNTWAQFYSERRLHPQVQMAAKASRLPHALIKRIDSLCARLPELVGPPEPPARLHGDLWAGNHAVDEHGLPVLIDPAVYAGHREVDLALMRLFGGYGPRVFAAYNDAFPLDPQHEQRVPLYQLYYLLVHVNLFGGSYVSGVEAALSSLGF